MRWRMPPLWRRGLTLLVLSAGALVAAAAAPSMRSAGVSDATAAPSCTPPPILQTSQLRAGMIGTGYTSLSGRTISPFRVKILGVLPDGIAPGMDFILIKAPKGIAAGYSGSPVYINGKLIGAVAYGFDSVDSTIGGITPAENMLGVLTAGDAAPALPRRVRMSPHARKLVARATGASAASVATAQQLPMPLAISGLNDRGMERFGKILDREKIAVALYRAGTASAATPSTLPLRPGSSFSAMLSYGDLTSGGTGTTTFTCGNRSVAFGHPFRFSGETTLGMSAADVLTVVHSTFGNYKVARIGELHGTVDQDRLAGVRGVAGMMPSLVPVTSDVTNVDLGRSRVGRTDVVQQETLPLLSAFHLLSNEDVTFDRIGGGSASLTFTINGTRGDGSPFTMTRTNAYFNEFDTTFPSIVELAADVNAIVNNPFEAVKVTGVHADASLTQRNTSAGIVRVLSASSLQTQLKERGVLRARPGDLIHLRVILQPAHKLGEPEPARIPVDLEVRAPRRGGGALLMIRGGTGETDCAFCIGEAGGPDAGTFDGLLKKLENAPRHSDLMATFRLPGGGKGDSVRSPQTHVVTGVQELVVVFG
ncbi:MAG: hypothetical protein QOJ13_1968 [Gaiellales bacterium]|nr:hypothetical protein [Gaiellales bacterium]